MVDQPVQLPEGYSQIFHEKVESTNTEALRLAEEGGAQPTWVWARTQTKGRGRHGRQWISLAGNLFASLALSLDCPPVTAAQLAFVGGLALCQTARQLSQSDQKPRFLLKWPNDLLCEGKKAGGILLESSAAADARLALAMGFGLNLAEHPQESEFPAISLAECGIKASPEKALEILAETNACWLEVWDKGRGFAEIRKAWQKHSFPLGAPLKLRLHEKDVEGHYQGIDETGALILRQPDQSEMRVTTGDVFPL